MSSTVESGILYGRPFGGVAILVSKHLVSHTQLVFASDRYVIAVVGDMLVVSVYLPCVGTDNRLFIVEETLCSISDWLSKYTDRSVLLGGDFNADLDKSIPVSGLINKFCADKCLSRCDLLQATGSKHCTYVNDSMGYESYTIDYFLISNSNVASAFQVLDDFMNLSDHLPLSVRCTCNFSNGHAVDAVDTDNMSVFSAQPALGSCRLVFVQRCN